MDPVNYVALGAERLLPGDIFTANDSNNTALVGTVGGNGMSSLTGWYTHLIRRS